MLRLISVLMMLWLAGTSWAHAQAFPPNEAGVTMGHLHLNTRDIEAHRKIFVTMGGEATKAGNFQVVRFPGVAVYLHQNNAPPPTGGTDGTIVNQVAFTVQNLQAAVDRWTAAGLEVRPSGNGGTDQALVVTPDGLRIETREDPKQKFPIQYHHMHFSVPTGQIAAIQAWYAKHFGARPSNRGQNQVADIPGVILVFSATDMPVATTKGRVLDHIGFDVRDLASFVKKLEAEKVKIDRPFTPNDLGGGLAFIYDPWGTYIELNQRPNPIYVTQ